MFDLEGFHVALEQEDLDKALALLNVANEHEVAEHLMLPNEALTDHAGNPYVPPIYKIFALVAKQGHMPFLEKLLEYNSFLQITPKLALPALYGDALEQGHVAFIKRLLLIPDLKECIESFIEIHLLDALNHSQLDLFKCLLNVVTEDKGSVCELKAKETIYPMSEAIFPQTMDELGDGDEQLTLVNEFTIDIDHPESFESTLLEMAKYLNKNAFVYALLTHDLKAGHLNSKALQIMTNSNDTTLMKVITETETDLMAVLNHYGVDVFSLYANQAAYDGLTLSSNIVDDLFGTNDIQASIPKDTTLLYAKGVLKDLAQANMKQPLEKVLNELPLFCGPKDVKGESFAAQTIEQSWRRNQLK